MQHVLGCEHNVPDSDNGTTRLDCSHLFFLFEFFFIFYKRFPFFSQFGCQLYPV